MGDRSGNGGNMCESAEGLKPVAGMVLVQFVLAGLNVLYKLAVSDGMNTMVLVAYRYLFAAAFLCPLAFFLERKHRPKLTSKILMQAFLCGLFGGALGQNMYVASVKMTSATFASAMTNLIPSMTFILAVLFRLEKLAIRTPSGQAKVLGTITGLAGAMVFTFYKGPDINLWSTNINILKHSQAAVAAPHTHGISLVGALLAIGSCLTISFWMIIQAKMSTAYPCAYSSTALVCLMGSIPATIVALCFERDMAEWRMGFDVRLLTVSYGGIVASGLIFSVIAWCIQKKGPLYATIFNPLMLVIVALLGSLLLNEKLHLGSIIGAALIVLGLYLVIWGKGREAARVAHSHAPSESLKEPSELPKMSSRWDPLDVVVVEGIHISRNTSFARLSSANSHPEGIHISRNTSFAHIPSINSHPEV